MSRTKKVPLQEVQGIILRGYEWLQEATFLLLRLSGDAERNRAWLKDLAPHLRDAKDKPDNAPTSTAINVAFTYRGLQRLGIRERGLSDRACQEGFAPEFLHGMDTDHRRRLLGDVDENIPDRWQWGNRIQVENEHALLMIYASTTDGLKANADKWKIACENAGIEVCRAFEIANIPGHREHFGFKDGIAQPVVRHVDKSNPPALQQRPSVSAEPKTHENTVETGEILLGYHNEYGRFPPSPIVKGADNQQFDFGRNGSYLVFRQLKQDVCGFWKYIDAEVKKNSAATGDALIAAREKLAAKMVGRWTSGAPLALSPNEDNPKLADADVFRFNDDDPIGLKTPIGSHIRRSNPRDSLEPGLDGPERLSATESLRVTRLHRIIRRGRPYGPPVAKSMKHADILDSDEARTGQGPERGLLFLCFNASISRQFELIQHTWINNPKFGGLYRENDPLMGTRKPQEMTITADIFSVPGEPVRHRHLNLPAFVQMRGGGYFFMPGINAVKFLAGLDVSLPSPPAKEEMTIIAPGQQS